jgi:hypothetical protein
LLLGIISGNTCVRSMRWPPKPGAELWLKRCYSASASTCGRKYAASSISYKVFKTFVALPYPRQIRVSPHTHVHFFLCKFGSTGPLGSVAGDPTGASANPFAYSSVPVQRTSGWRLAGEAARLFSPCAVAADASTCPGSACYTPSNFLTFLERPRSLKFCPFCLFSHIFSWGVAPEWVRVRTVLSLAGPQAAVVLLLPPPFYCDTHRQRYFLAYAEHREPEWPCHDAYNSAAPPSSRRLPKRRQ